MQTTPKKVKYTASVKAVHGEQAAKLKQKHVQELEFLDDVRVFAQQRAVIERVYSNALCKAAQQFLAKKSFSAAAEDDVANGEHKLASRVWKMLLEETVKVGVAHQSVSDVYLRHVADALKTFKSRKQQAGKRALVRLKAMQMALVQSVGDMERSHRSYSDSEHEAHVAREKVIVAEEKLRNRSTGLFSSMSSLEKAHVKLVARKDLHETKSTVARNDYVLNMSAANAHTSSFYNSDLLDTIHAIEQQMCERLKEMSERVVEKEMECARTALDSFSKLAGHVTQISPEYELEHLLSSHAVLRESSQFNFEAQDNDPVKTVSCDCGQMEAMCKEASKWCAELSASVRVMREAEMELQKLDEEARMAGDEKQKQNQQLDMKRDNWLYRMRLARLNKLMAEARLAALELGGIDVDHFREQEQIAEEAAGVALATVNGNGHHDDGHGGEGQPQMEHDSDEGVGMHMHIAEPENSDVFTLDESVNGTHVDNKEKTDVDTYDPLDMGQETPPTLMRDNSETIRTFEQSLLDEINENTQLHMKQNKQEITDGDEDDDEEEDMVDEMNGCLQPIGEDADDDTAADREMMDDPQCHSPPDDDCPLSADSILSPVPTSVTTNSSINQPSDRPVSLVEPQASFTIADAADNDRNSENELMLVPQEAGDSDIAVTSHDTCDTPPPLPPPPPPDAELITDIPPGSSHVTDRDITEYVVRRPSLAAAAEAEVDFPPVDDDDFLNNSECNSDGIPSRCSYILEEDADHDLAYSEDVRCSVDGGSQPLDVVAEAEEDDLPPAATASPVPLALMEANDQRLVDLDLTNTSDNHQQAHGEQSIPALQSLLHSSMSTNPDLDENEQKTDSKDMTDSDKLESTV